MFVMFLYSFWFVIDDIYVSDHFTSGVIIKINVIWEHLIFGYISLKLTVILDLAIYDSQFSSMAQVTVTKWDIQLLLYLNIL